MIPIFSDSTLNPDGHHYIIVHQLLLPVYSLHDKNLYLKILQYRNLHKV